MNCNNGVITSSPSTYKVAWKVTNNLDFPVRVLWVDFEGKKDPRNGSFVVQPNETAAPGYTFVGHVFLVTNDTSAAPTEHFVSAINVMGAHTTIG